MSYYNSPKQYERATGKDLLQIALAFIEQVA